MESTYKADCVSGKIFLAEVQAAFAFVGEDAASPEGGWLLQQQMVVYFDKAAGQRRGMADLYRSTIYVETV